MLILLIFGALLIAVTAVTEAVSRRLKLPQSIALALADVALGFSPGLGHVTVEPELVILVKAFVVPTGYVGRKADWDYRASTVVHDPYGDRPSSRRIYRSRAGTSHH